MSCYGHQVPSDWQHCRNIDVQVDVGELPATEDDKGNGSEEDKAKGDE